MSKIDLKDVTFCIPVYLDSIHRKQNLDLILKYLTHYFDTNIIIGETAHDNKPKLEYLKKNYDYLFYNNPDEFFYKTRLLNMMYLKSNTPYLFSYDCDSLFYPQQIEKCIMALRNGIYDACFPFRDVVIQIPREFYIIIYETLDLSKIKKPNNMKEDEWKQTHQSSGLGLALSKDILAKIGFENENFKSWGPEDCERVYRIEFMGGKIGKVLGPGYHMNHFRGIHSTDKNVFFQSNWKEFDKIKSFKTQTSLINYLQSFSWYKRLIQEYKNVSKTINSKNAKKIITISHPSVENKIDFNNKVTFIMPFYYDTDDRLENVNLSLEYLYKHVNAPIIIGEMGSDSSFQYDLHKRKDNVSYKFYDEDIFSKTKLINNLVKEVNTEFFCIHDVDIFLTRNQLRECLEHVKHDLLDVIIPYNGLYLEIPRKFKKQILNLKDIKELDNQCSYRFLKEHYLGTGACIFFRRDSFIESGMMNQFFKKWGQEDDEVVYRMFTLGNNIIRMKTNDPIHHLMHEIDKKGFGYQEHNLSNIQQEEFRRIKAFTYGEMRIYANKLIKENI